MKLTAVCLTGCLIVISISIISCEINSNEQSGSLIPVWAKDLVIYEIATKGFTSPAGPESGTFNSLREKLPYLEELAIQGYQKTLELDPDNWYAKNKLKQLSTE
jgi:hypothetical protein